MSVAAWILGIAFLIACPQALPVALAAVAWLFVDPIGTALLGVAFVLSLAYCMAGALGSPSWRRA